MAIERFLNPKDRLINNNTEKVFLPAIIEQYTKTPEGIRESAKKGGDEIIEKILFQEVIRALETVMLFERQQEASEKETIRRISTIKNTILQMVSDRLL